MKLSQVVFLEVGDVVAIHALCIARFGGSDGLRDRGLLESAVHATRSDYYGSLAELAAVYAHGLAKNHAFVDGNKRIAITVAATFLAVNGFELRLNPAKWEVIVLGVVTGSVSREELAAYFASEMGDPVVLEA